jgi:hypothetical protein
MYNACNDFWDKVGNFLVSCKDDARSDDVSGIPLHSIGEGTVGGHKSKRNSENTPKRAKTHLFYPKI